MRFSVDAVNTIWRPLEERVWTRGRAQCYAGVNKGGKVECRNGKILFRRG
jgi:hypothetical protein